MSGDKVDLMEVRGDRVPREDFEFLKSKVERAGIVPSNAGVVRFAFIECAKLLRERDRAASASKG